MRWPHPDFVVGANLPWLSYGGDFGANSWHADGGVARPGQREHLRRVLSALADEGVQLVRWFVLCDGRAGLIDELRSGLPGLDGFVFRDADAAVEELERAGLKAIFVLLDFHWFRRAEVVNGVQTGGRGRLASDPAQRSHLFEGVLDPLLERYGRHPAIAAWDVINEPEWAIRRIRIPSPACNVSRTAMRAFIRDTVTLIHHRTTHAATVGSASTRSLPLVQGLGLDLYQAHWYDRLDARAPLDRPVAGLGLDRPLLLGEFPTRGSARAPADILTTARLAGYAGALSWSVLSADDASDHAGIAGAIAGIHHTRTLNGLADLE
jgi:mannan endo-1,4-beta-mannosidase